jgi:hypothetical protein
MFTDGPSLAVDKNICNVLRDDIPGSNTRGPVVLTSHVNPLTSGVIMPLQVCNNAVLMCTMGVAPSNLVVTPEKMVNTSFQPAANIMDHVPMKNIMPFGMCISPANPQVAAATAAALGVLTPQPCIPNTPAPWTPGSPTILLKNFPALNNTSTLNCLWAGVITVQFPGQTTHVIP